MFAFLSKESSLGKHILFRMAKAALRSVPFIGGAFELFDEVVLESLIAEEQENRDKVQAEMQQMLLFLYENLSSMVERLEAENIGNDALEERLAKEEFSVELTKVAEKLNAQEAQYQNLTVRFHAFHRKIEANSQKIGEIAAQVEAMSKNFDIGGHFKHIGQSIKNRLNPV